MKTHPEERPVAEAAARLKAQLGATPEVAIVLGSGLSSVADAMAIEADATYAELGLPDTSVAGHNGHAYVGQLGGRRVIVLSGRVHFYEGQGMATVVRTTRAMHRWGVPTMMLTNSAGGIDREYVPGDLVLVRDHLNLLGESPLFGPAYGERFPDMTYAYDPDLRRTLLAGADRAGVHLHEGVYAAMMGPSYETPAEIRMIEAMGADLAGMSTVPEVLAARALGMRCAAIAVVANLAAGLAPGTLHHDEVTSAGGEAGSRLAAILEASLGDF